MVPPLIFLIILQLSAAQTVGLIRAASATSQHSVIQETSTVIVQHQTPTRQQGVQMQQQHHHQHQIQQQIQQQIHQQKLQQEQQHQIQQQQQFHQLQQRQVCEQPTVLQGSHLSGTPPGLPEQPHKRRFREEAPEDDSEDALLGYQVRSV